MSLKKSRPSPNESAVLIPSSSPSFATAKARTRGPPASSPRHARVTSFLLQGRAVGRAPLPGAHSPDGVRVLALSALQALAIQAAKARLVHYPLDGPTLPTVEEDMTKKLNAISWRVLNAMEGEEREEEDGAQEDGNVRRIKNNVQAIWSLSSHASLAGTKPDYLHVTGLLAKAMPTPVDIMVYLGLTGHMPAYTTLRAIPKALVTHSKGLSQRMQTIRQMSLPPFQERPIPPALQTAISIATEESRGHGARQAGEQPSGATMPSHRPRSPGLRLPSTSKLHRSSSTRFALWRRLSFTDVMTSRKVHHVRTHCTITNVPRCAPYSGFSIELVAAASDGGTVKISESWDELSKHPVATLDVGSPDTHLCWSEVDQERWPFGRRHLWRANNPVPARFELLTPSVGTNYLTVQCALAWLNPDKLTTKPSPDTQTFTVRKLDAGMAILLGERAHLIEFPSILLPLGATTGSIVNIVVHQNRAEEKRRDAEFWELQDDILKEYGVNSPKAPELKVRNVTQTSVTLEWPVVDLASAKLRSLDIYRNNQRLAAIPSPRPTPQPRFPDSKSMPSTHEVLLENAKMALGEMDAKWSDKIQIDTTHFVCTTPAATPAGTQATGRASGAPGVEYRRALLLSIPVVQPLWILACHSEQRMMPIAPYHLVATLSTPASARYSSNRPQSMAHSQTPYASPATGDRSKGTAASYRTSPFSAGASTGASTVEESGTEDADTEEVILEVSASLADEQTLASASEEWKTSSSTTSTLPLGIEFVKIWEGGDEANKRPVVTVDSCCLATAECWSTDGPRMYIGEVNN
ncbi:hypothetical protein BKA70DRAFT_1559014 [Coprinopsis sp. MPI-PUGE-AT-0042]|nr:hypothetical protein BKA70DRAFT_1559014 [Coprinopsis sp. MPI-PUGE-AT-0042]